LEIIRHLLRLDRALTHEWRLYTHGLPPDLFLDTGAPGGQPAPPHRVVVLPARRMWTHRSLAQEVTQHSPDVLFVPAHVLPFVWPPGRLPPAVVTIHDLGHRRFPHAHTIGQRLYLELSTRWAVHAARRLIAVSQATGRDLTLFYGATPEKIAVIYEAASPRTAPSPIEIEAAQTACGLLRPYALYVGSIQPRKNLERLIMAFARLCDQQRVEFDLVLAGAVGWLSDSIFRCAAQTGLADRIHFTGYLADADLAALLQGARLFCYPSLLEGFGLPVLEAQYAGIPVMTANNSSLPEVAGDAALLVDPTDIDAIADAMLRLSRDEELRQRLIAAGHENVKRFSWQDAAQKTLAVLEQAARSKR
jgi:glycosyltransferase involved in cell wall biosynthesis